MAVSEPASYLITLFVTSVLYGIYVPMHTATMHILTRKNRSSHSQMTSSLRRLLIVIGTAVFILETLAVMFNFIRCYDLFISPSQQRDGAIGIGIVGVSRSDPTTTDALFQAATYLVVPFSDAVLVCSRLV